MSKKTKKATGKTSKAANKGCGHAGGSVSTPALRVLTAAAIDHEVHSYSHDPRNSHYGAEAIDKLAAVVAPISVARA